MRANYGFYLLLLGVTVGLTSASAQDVWLGGTGNWSNGGLWSYGTQPAATDNVTIYSGGTDIVTLDVSSARG